MEEKNKTPLTEHKYMKLTNKTGLPDIIMKAVSLDLYDGGSSDISVTALIDSPQIRYLKKTNNVEYDGIDFLWTTMGSAIHTFLEYAEYTQYEVQALKQASDVISRHGRKDVGEWIDKFINEKFPDHINHNVVQEKRLHAEVDGWTISGKPDRVELDNKKIIDFKMTSAWIWDKTDEHDKYKYQLSIYRWLLHQYDIEIDTAEIIFIFRDWSKMTMLRSPSYPRRRVETLEIELMSLEETEAYIKNRIYLHKEAEKGHVPMCTDKEVWARGASYKCYKKKGKVVNKRAMNGGTHDTYESALAFKAKVKDKLMPNEDVEIKYNPPVRGRCESYCAVSQFCTQYKDFLDNLNNEK